jgi:HK97 family phage major capsid protein
MVSADSGGNTPRTGMNNNFSRKYKRSERLVAGTLPFHASSFCLRDKSTKKAEPTVQSERIRRGIHDAHGAKGQNISARVCRDAKQTAATIQQHHSNFFDQMKSFFKKFRHLTALLAVCVLAFALVMLGAPMAVGIFIIGLWQLSQIAMSKRLFARCNMALLSNEQIKEFEDILSEFRDFGQFIPGFKELEKAEGGKYAIKKLPSLLKDVGVQMDQLQKEVNRMKKGVLGTSRTGVTWVGDMPYVTDDCAAHLTATLIYLSSKIDGKMENAFPDASKRKNILQHAASILGVEMRAGGALSPTDVPLPTIYAPQIVELVFAYGQARKYATVFPLGAGTVKLPRLKAGEDQFGYLGVGTAGISQNVPQKEVTAELVTFTANKLGGIIRIPTELDEDTFIPLGQFLARYIARQFAKLEDSTLFLGDGTGTYANITGVGPYCVANPAYLQQLAAGKTIVTQATINDFRAMRGKVNPAVLFNMAANGKTSAAYYMSPSMEALLWTFNTIGTPFIYVPESSGKPATLDGFPIHWIGVSQPYSTAATPSAFIAFFGDLSFWYLGERGAPRIEVSREVFFATDELAMRALERIDVEAMAIDAMTALQTAAQ